LVRRKFVGKKNKPWRKRAKKGGKRIDVGKKRGKAK